MSQPTVIPSTHRAAEALCRTLSAETLTMILRDCEGWIDLTLEPADAWLFGHIIHAAQDQLARRREARYQNSRE